MQGTIVEFVVAVVPVFIASVVECVEAWTIVVAVGLTRGWRAALIGVAAALAVIGTLVAIFGAAVVNSIDEHIFEVVIGTLLVLFGLRWMRKAILRYVGVISIHDEDVAFRNQIDELSHAPGVHGFDWIAFAIAGKAMLLEGMEITFLVVTLGASGTTSYPVAITGAAAAFVLVGATGFFVRGPLSKVPENTLKAFVSIMLATFGTYWVAQGFGVEWAGGAWALVYLFVLWWVVVAGTVTALRSSMPTTPSRPAEVEA
jgi:uncharacterized membrane protein